MDMNKAFFLRNEDRNPKWHHIDATGMVLGRLCTQIADTLRGKDKSHYTPHTDAGDYVVVTNCDKIVLTGDKWDSKIYRTHSGYRGGLKELTAREVSKRHADHLIMHAVKGMLPKSKLSNAMIKKLKVYAGSAHPHEAQLGSK